MKDLRFLVLRVQSFQMIECSLRQLVNGVHKP